MKLIVTYRILFCWFLICFVSANSLYGQCVDNSNYWEESWISCDISASPNSVRGAGHWLLYEFVEPQAIGSSHIWNANRPGESNLGAKEVYVDVSVDGNNWISVDTASFIWPKGTEAIDYDGFNGPDLLLLALSKKCFFLLKLITIARPVFLLQK